MLVYCTLLNKQLFRYIFIANNGTKTEKEERRKKTVE